MNLYATAGDFDSVLKTWDEYRCSGDEKKGCTESYNIVMQVYMSLGKDSEAVQTFDQMINEGGIPNSRTFTIMIEHEEFKNMHEANLEDPLSNSIMTGLNSRV
ncbi:hypothetical protein AALP_AA8G503200 [Arabis alpina]|uniref:Pentacotripeptide-repeat region of PRORP domain-containing protein n=1 Tax=Arabis alpina TaxID=50452 RepID=A0A087GEN5_ARAAL|nr:hypothetical protein AALP_AA8G503200 [Arabis alpina]